MGQHTHFLCARDRVQPPLGWLCESRVLSHACTMYINVQAQETTANCV